jgi:hypothetical protein
MVVAGLVAAYEQNCRAPWIKGVESTQRLSAALRAQLAHVTVLRASNS